MITQEDRINTHRTVENILTAFFVPGHVRGVIRKYKELRLELLQLQRKPYKDVPHKVKVINQKELEIAMVWHELYKHRTQPEDKVIMSSCGDLEQCVSMEV